MEKIFLLLLNTEIFFKFSSSNHAIHIQNIQTRNINRKTITTYYIFVFKWHEFRCINAYYYGKFKIDLMIWFHYSVIISSLKWKKKLKLVSWITKKKLSLRKENWKGESICAFLIGWNFDSTWSQSIIIFYFLLLSLHSNLLDAYRECYFIPIQGLVEPALMFFFVFHRIWCELKQKSIIFYFANAIWWSFETLIL